MDSVGIEGGTATYRWTLTGTNTGPGGTGRKVRITGYEEWTLGADGLIARSLGHFDEAEYTRQLGKRPLAVDAVPHGWASAPTGPGQRPGP